MSDEPTTRRGKIARLPANVRKEVCQRLHDGQSASQIIPWLHGLPDVLRVLDEHFGEEPISPQNLSDWRKGGYQDWLRARARVDDLKQLSQYAFDLAKAGGSLTEGAAAIAGGKILTMFENLNEENIEKLIASLSSLRTSEASSMNARTNQARLAQKDREIDLEEKKFRRTTAELFIKWAQSPEAQAILGSGDTKTVQMDKLVQLFFGTAPEMQAREGE